MNSTRKLFFSQVNQARKHILKSNHKNRNYSHSANPPNQQKQNNRSYTVPAGTPGAGAGKGGGAGGSIKESGGGLGKYGAAQEEGYFYNKDREQMEKIKRKVKSEPAKPEEVRQNPEESP